GDHQRGTRSRAARAARGAGGVASRGGKRPGRARRRRRAAPPRAASGGGRAMEALARGRDGRRRGAGPRWDRRPGAGSPRPARPLVREGPADADAAAGPAGLLPRLTQWLVAPALPLLAAVLATASAYAGADSGVSQLAAAVGAPAVIRYPAATREAWGPWSAS